MKHGIWLPNIKKYLSGSMVGSDATLNVNVLNTVPVPVAPAQFAYKEHRYMDSSIEQIEQSSGAWKEIGDTNFPAADVANTCTEMRLYSTIGSPLLVGVGANAGAVSVIGTAGPGQANAVGVSLSAGDKIWVKALLDTDIDSGELLVTLLG